MHAERRQAYDWEMQQSTTLVIISTAYHKNADVERPLLNSEIDRFGSDADDRGAARIGSSAPRSYRHEAVLSPETITLRLQAVVRPQSIVYRSSSGWITRVLAGLCKPSDNSPLPGDSVTRP